MMNMKTKWTAGPWTIKGFHVGDGSATLRAESIEPNICEMASSRSPEETRANAQLIAAAPEMADVLRYCVTEDGAHCLAYGTDTPKLRARLQAINAIVCPILARLEGGR